jgi:hypothetical protein
VHEVEATYAQRGHLSESDAGVSEKQHDEAVRTAGFGELVDLLMAQVHALLHIHAR